MKKYHSKPAQQATYIRVYEGERRLQGAEVISVIHGLQAEVEQQTQRAEKAEGDLAKANERVAELELSMGKLRTEILHACVEGSSSSGGIKKSAAHHLHSQALMIPPYAEKLRKEQGDDK